MSSVLYHGNLPPPATSPKVGLLSSNAIHYVNLVQRLSDAGQLVVLDPMSFPYELLDERLWNIPIAVRLPENQEDSVVHDVLGPPLLSRLTPFDTLIVERRQDIDLEPYRFKIGPGQVMETWPPQWLSTLLERPELAERASSHLLRSGQDPNVWWALPTRLNKTVHNQRARAIAEVLAERPDLTSARREIGVLIAGSSSTPVRAMLPPSLVSAASMLDLSTEGVGFRTAQWPGSESKVLGPQMLFPYSSQSFDVVVATWLYSRLAPSQWQAVSSELQRVVRPGGLLLILDRFVPRDPGLEVVSFQALRSHFAIHLTHTFVLRDLHSLTYPHHTGPTDAIVVLSSLGSFTRP